MAATAEAVSEMQARANFHPSTAEGNSSEPSGFHPDHSLLAKTDLAIGLGLMQGVPEIVIPDREILSMPTIERNRAFVNLFKARARAMNLATSDATRDEKIGSINAKLNSLVPGFEVQFELSPRELETRDVLKDMPLALDDPDSLSWERRLRAISFLNIVANAGYYHELKVASDAIRKKSTFELRGKVISQPWQNGGDWKLDRVLLRAEFEAQARAEIIAEDASVERGRLKLVYDADARTDSHAAA